MPASRGGETERASSAARTGVEATDGETDVPAATVDVRRAATIRTSRSGAACPATGVAAAAAIAAYAWWATGLQPFTTRAYVAVGIPVAALTIAAVVARPGGSREGRSPASPAARQSPLRAALPWVLVLVLVAGLEAVGLALGGRSGRVPTLSTVVDHALAWHSVRFAMFCGWLATGWAPVFRAALCSRDKVA